LLISEYAATVIEHSGYFKQGFSFQLGSGGASLSAAKFIREKMLAKGITAAFGVGGITGLFVEMLEEGLVDLLFDAQSFDSKSIESLRQNPRHLEMSAAYYASPGNCGPIVNNVDVVILSATEVDIHFNVNVLTGSNGKLMGAPGGHPDTAAGSKLCIVTLPLMRKNFSVIREAVHTIVTPGETVDVIVTDRGVAINPLRQDLISNLKDSGLPILPIEALWQLGNELAGPAEPAPMGGDIVGLVEYRDGTIIDVIRQLG